MSHYIFKALATDGELVNGKLRASSKDSAFAQLRQMGYIPLAADAQTTAEPGSKIRLSYRKSKRVSQNEVLVFTRELAVMLKAGISVDIALNNLAAARGSGSFPVVLREVADAVKNGHTLADALVRHADVFPGFYVGLVGAGEAGGNLPAILHRIAATLQNMQRLREQVHSALVYPLIVLIMVGLSFVVIMVWVIPEFRPVLETQGTAVPLSAKVVLALSDMTIRWGWLMGLTLLLAAIAAKGLLAGEKVKDLRDRQLVALPIVGEIVRQVEAARFCRTLGVLITSGMPLLDAIGVAGRAVENRVLARLFRSTGDPVSRGESLAAALEYCGTVPALTVQLVRVGEESGRLPEMLQLSAEDAEEKAQKTIHRLVTALAPTVTVCLGAVVATLIGIIISAVMSSYNVTL